MAKVRYEINVLNRSVTGVTGDLEELAYVDPVDYSGALTYWFEVVAANADGAEKDIYLHDDADNIHATAALAASSGITRVRIECSTALTADEYHINIEDTDINVLAARIIILQDDTPITGCETQIEVGDYEMVTSEAYVPLTYPKYWYYDSSKWNGTVTFYAAVTYKSGGSMDEFSCELQEDDGAFDNWTSAVVVVNAGSAETPTYKKSASFTPTNGRNYRMAFKTTDSMDTDGYLYNAKIIIQQHGNIVQLEDNFQAKVQGGDGVGGSEAIGQSFTTIGAIDVDSIWLKPAENGTCADNLYIDISTSIGGAPIANGTSNDVAISGLDYTPVEFTFSTPPSLEATTKYYFMVYRDGNRDTSNYAKIRYHSIYDNYNNNGYYTRASGVWGVEHATIDLYFIIDPSVDGVITKLEPQYLLVNTGKTAEGQLMDYDTLYDADEWDGVTVNLYAEHNAGEADSETKLQEVGTGDIANSTITGANRQRGGSAMTITDDATVDTYIVEAGTP